MATPDDGGPAFPHGAVVHVDAYDPGVREEVYATCRGMSLRDYFAGQALASFGLGLLTSEIVIAGYAERAYQFADAMLKQRSQSHKT